MLEQIHERGYFNSVYPNTEASWFVMFRASLPDQRCVNAADPLHLLLNS